MGFPWLCCWRANPVGQLFSLTHPTNKCWDILPIPSMQQSPWWHHIFKAWGFWLLGTGTLGGRNIPEYSGFTCGRNTNVKLLEPNTNLNPNFFPILILWSVGRNPSKALCNTEFRKASLDSVSAFSVSVVSAGVSNLKSSRSVREA